MVIVTAKAHSEPIQKFKIKLIAEILQTIFVLFSNSTYCIWLPFLSPNPKKFYWIYLILGCQLSIVAAPLSHSLTLKFCFKDMRLVHPSLFYYCSCVVYGYILYHLVIICLIMVSPCWLPYFVVQITELTNIFYFKSVILAIWC